MGFASSIQSMAVDSGRVGDIKWLVVPAPDYINNKAFNGYVILPEDHPYYNLGYEDVTDWPGQELTYGDEGAFGFDCLHLNDSWPGSTWYNRADRGMPDEEAGMGFSRRVWNQDLVTEEVQRLAGFMNSKRDQE